MIVKTTARIAELQSQKAAVDAQRNEISDQITAILREREAVERELRLVLDKLHDKARAIDLALAQAVKEAAA